MKFEEARQELKRCLSESQTISIPKLRKIIMSLNISLSQTQRVLEIRKKEGTATIIEWNGNRYILDGKK